jgi:hypothetical protein
VSGEILQMPESCIGGNYGKLRGFELWRSPLLPAKKLLAGAKAPPLGNFCRAGYDTGRRKFCRAGHVRRDCRRKLQ